MSFFRPYFIYKPQTRTKKEVAEIIRQPPFFINRLIDFNTLEVQWFRTARNVIQKFHARGHIGAEETQHTGGGHA